jgi:cytochrome c556
MSKTLKEFLDSFNSSFDSLSEAEKKRAANAIWRRLAKLEYGPLTDAALAATAEAAFLELDAREAADAKRRAR